MYTPWPLLALHISGCVRDPDCSRGLYPYSHTGPSSYDKKTKEINKVRHNAHTTTYYIKFQRTHPVPMFNMPCLTDRNKNNAREMIFKINNITIFRLLWRVCRFSNTFNRAGRERVDSSISCQFPCLNLYI